MSWWHQPIVRPRSGGVFGGVLAGIAAAYGIDVKVARVIVGIGAFVFPPTIPLYLAAWILFPREPDPARAPADLVRGGGRTWLVVGLAFVAFLIFMGGGWDDGPGRGGNLLGAALLIGLGAWLWSQRSHPSPTDPSGNPVGSGAGDGGPAVAATASPGARAGAGASTGAGAGGSWSTPAATWRGTSTATLDLPPPPAPPPTPPPPPGPPIGRVTTAAALIALGLVVAGDRIGWYRLDVAAALAVLLGITGLGLLAGAVLGGGRGLIAPAILLLFLTVTTAGLGRVHLAGAIGERTVRPVTVAEAEDGYDHGVGRLTVDLRRLPSDWLGDEAVDVAAELAVGEVRVLVPDGVDLEVTADVGIGRVDALDRSAEGLGNDDTFRFDDPASDRLLRLDLDVGIGHVEVDVERVAVPVPAGTR